MTQGWSPVAVVVISAILAELERLMTASQQNQQVIFDLLPQSGLTAAQISSLQGFDRVTQGLGDLTVLARYLADEAPADLVSLANLRSTLRLQEISAALTSAPALPSRSDPASAPGEVELF